MGIYSGSPFLFSIAWPHIYVGSHWRWFGRELGLYVGFSEMVNLIQGFRGVVVRVVCGLL